ncbi:MAG: DedA family protein [Alphaproteobacteria bacterium]|jgi:membrane protein YqaA with SNARE-associated domain|nr:DedA family protein [Alphaproteobacteria bacterium]
MLRATYDWTMRLSASPHAVWMLAAIAFIESSFFPIPVDLLLIPMILAARNKAWRLAAICTVMSVAGGYFGYLIGYALFDAIGQPIISFYGFEHTFESFTERYNEFGAWIVFIFGVTPFPYKVVTIASGVTQLDPAVFGLASVAARGLRFFLVAALIWYFGPAIRSFVEKHLGWVALAFIALLVSGFALIEFVA